MQQKGSVHFEGLNLLRFVAAMMILVFYAVEETVPDSPLKMFVHNFPIGVDFFFIISGFLITYLLLQEKSSYQKINIGAFYLRRILRIFPLYYLIIFCNFLVFNSNAFLHFNYSAQLFSGKILKPLKKENGLQVFFHRFEHFVLKNISIGQFRY
ncbi:MAG: acyltransferase [Chitinophagales bacterium]|nr:acyltransferase [Chitinophagales bacterium]